MNGTSGKLYLIMGGVSAVALMHASAAFAQNSIPVAASTSVAPTSAVTSADTGAQVQEVVVTATKRSERAQAVPQEVTAVGASQLTELHAQSIEDIAAFAPGVSFQTRGGGSDLIAIRGVTTGGAQLGSAIGLYLDDVPVGESNSFGSGASSIAINLFDLDRVEVLNGPQGTLYGAGSLGGTVKYITASPNLSKFSAEAEAEVSSTEHAPTVNDGFRGMVNLPFDQGHAAIRIDGFDQYDAGYTSDPLYHRQNEGTGKSSGGRVSLLFQPTNDLDIRLSAFTQGYRFNEIDYGAFSPVTHQFALGPYEQESALPQPGSTALTVYSGVLNWDLHWAKLTSVTGYQDSKSTSVTDFTHLYDPILSSTDLFDFGVIFKNRRFTQEVRLASQDNKRFEWMIGGYYDDESSAQRGGIHDVSYPNGELYGLYVPLVYNEPSTYQEFSVFGNATAFITDRFDVALGVRYSWQHQTFQESNSGLFGGNGLSGPYVEPTVPSNQSVATYLVNPRYRITDNLMVYARIASGFRPGGPNFVVGPGLGNPTFASDSLWNYEIGEKATLLDKRATLDVDVYDIEWNNIQLSVVNAGQVQLENAGNARVQGAEAAFNYRILPDLTLGGSGAYTDARLLTTAPVLGVFYTGARLPSSPRYTFALLGKYDFQIADGYSGALTISDRWVGDRTSGYIGSASSPNYTLPAYNTVDVDLALFAPDRVQVDLYVKNLFDTVGQLTAVTDFLPYDPTLPVPVSLSLPRTVGLVVKAKF